jgi:hypothetical protein
MKTFQEFTSSATTQDAQGFNVNNAQKSLVTNFRKQGAAGQEASTTIIHLLQQMAASSPAEFQQVLNKIATTSTAKEMGVNFDSLFNDFKMGAKKSVGVWNSGAGNQNQLGNQPQV